MPAAAVSRLRLKSCRLTILNSEILTEHVNIYMGCPVIWLRVNIPVGFPGEPKSSYHLCTDCVRTDSGAKQSLLSGLAAAHAREDES